MQCEVLDKTLERQQKDSRKPEKTRRVVADLKVEISPFRYGTGVLSGRGRDKVSTPLSPLFCMSKISPK